MSWMHNMTRLFYSANSGTVAIGTLFIILAIYFRWKILELLYKKDTWAVAAMFHCSTMMSGHMWNKIRKPVFSVNTQDGPVLFSNGQKWQFLAESYIIAVTNSAAVMGLILIIEAAGGVRGTGVDRIGERKKRRLQMLAGLGLVLGSFSVLLFAFTVKRPWYPYRQFLNEVRLQMLYHYSGFNKTTLTGSRQ